MKAESEVRPEEFSVDIRNDIAIITFYENVEEIIEEENTKYNYNCYELKMQNKENLKEEIKNNYEKYLAIAKNEEKKTLASEIREKRDKLLLETDKYLLDDFPITNEEREKYKLYRQALRDITKQVDFPYNVEFPQIT